MSETKPLSTCSVFKDDVAVMAHEDTSITHVIKMEEVDIKPDYIVCDSDGYIKMKDMDDQTDNGDSSSGRGSSRGSGCQEDPQELQMVRAAARTSRAHMAGLTAAQRSKFFAMKRRSELHRVLLPDAPPRKRRNRIRSTAKQLKLLVDYMTTHPKLAHGEFSGPQGLLLETRHWEELRAMLSEHGPDKSVDQWKVSWRDMRRKARTEGLSVNRASLATGDAVEIPALSDMSKKILAVMGTEGAIGIQGGEESGMSETKPLSTCSVSKDDVAVMAHEDTALEQVIKMEEVDIKPDYIVCDSNGYIEMKDMDEQTDNSDSSSSRGRGSSRGSDRGRGSNRGTGHQEDPQELQMVRAAARTTRAHMAGLTAAQRSKLIAMKRRSELHRVLPNAPPRKRCNRTRSTAKQLKLLVDYMTTHPKLAHGEFSGPQGRLLETRQWEELRAMLSEHGPSKSVDQWKVSWRDMRRRARTEGSSVNRASLATGNAVEIPALSDMSKNILVVMGTEGAFGIQGGEESGIVSATTLSTFESAQLVTFDEVVGSSNVTNEEIFVETIQQDSSQTSIAGSSQQQHPERVQVGSSNVNNEEIVVETIQQDFSQTSVAGSSQQQLPQRVRRQQRRRQLERARRNQFLEAELESNNILRDIAKQLAIANTHSAIRSRSAFKEKLWRLRRDLFK